MYFNFYSTLGRPAGSQRRRDVRLAFDDVQNGDGLQQARSIRVHIHVEFHFRIRTELHHADLSEGGGDGEGVGDTLGEPENVGVPVGVSPLGGHYTGRPVQDQDYVGDGRTGDGLNIRKMLINIKV